MDRTNRENDVPANDASEQIGGARIYGVGEEVVTGGPNEYGRRDIDQVQPGEEAVEQGVEPARDIDQIQPGEVYTDTSPGTEPLTGDLDTGHIDHEHVRDVNTQPRLPVDQTQTTRPLAPGSAETRVLPPQPDTVPGGTTTTGNEDDFTPYVPENDNSA